MGQNGNHRAIEYESYMMHGSQEYGVMLLNLGNGVAIQPIAESVAQRLEERLGTPVKVAQFTPNTRHIDGKFQPGGDYATYHLQAENRPDVKAFVECSDENSDWVNIRLNVKNGLDAREFLEQYRNISLTLMPNPP
ncbi:hypothetical protein J4480_05215 [Candidatus Woesearchaeota archaeon]|nr:hypothetical protein [Candidatus Woesearchaeota archaeon]